MLINDMIKLSWKGFEKLEILEYEYASEFNKLQMAKKIEGTFRKESEFKFEAI